MISRRVFLKNGAFALVSVGFAPSFLARTAFAQSRSARAKQLIAIFQRGAVDGLSVVVPFGDAEYYRARPSIAIAQPNAGESAAVDLDGFFGLNPRMRPLMPLWNSRQLAIVHACGSPELHAVAFRRAGLHGNRDARREEHGRRLAEPVSPGATRRSSLAVPRGLFDGPAPTDAAGSVARRRR